MGCGEWTQAQCASHQAHAICRVMWEWGQLKVQAGVVQMAVLGAASAVGVVAPWVTGVSEHPDAYLTMLLTCTAPCH